jgi:predicted nucleic acid-binding protein
MLVVDASAVLKWFLPEPESLLAAQLVGRGTPLIAPGYLLVEVAHVLLKKERRREASAGLANDAIGWLRASDIRFLPDETLISTAVPLAAEHRHGVFDCLYLAAAFPGPKALATFDRPMAMLAGRLGIPLWSPDTSA